MTCRRYVCINWYEFETYREKRVTNLPSFSHFESESNLIIRVTKPRAKSYLNESFLFIYELAHYRKWIADLRRSS